MKKLNKLTVLLFLGALALVLAGCGGSGSSTSTTGSIEGYIMETESNPVGGVSVVTDYPLQNVTVSVSGTTAITDAEGHFRIDKIPAGTKTVTLACEGFDSTSFSAQITAGKVTQVGKRYYFRPDARIGGRVVIQGAAPGQTLTVTAYVGAVTYEVLTDSQGYYTLPPNAYSVGSQVEIEVDGSYNYGTAYEMGLNSWTWISAFPAPAGIVTVPNLDLHAYVSLQSPTTSVVLPTTVIITGYPAGRLDPLYWLYFWDLNDPSVRIGSTDDFYSTSYDFDGTLVEGGTLNQDAKWYVGSGYTENGYYLYANSFGEVITMGVGPLAIKTFAPAPGRNAKDRR